MTAFDPELGLPRLLDPEVLANSYPFYARLRDEAPVYFEPFFHTWVVTRYADVMKVLLTFSADRTPSPDQLNAMGMSAIGPIAQVMGLLCSGSSTAAHKSTIQPRLPGSDAPISYGQQPQGIAGLPNGPAID